MKRIALLVALVAGTAAAAAGPYARDTRVDTIARTLDALGDDAAALEEQILRASRTECRATFGRPPTRCLLRVAGETCDALPAAEREACRLAADVIITNRIGERELVDQQTRVKLMRSGDYRAALRAELRARYAAIAAELALSPELRRADRLAEGIDAFCVRWGRTHRLAWQRCVAAIAWYIRTDDPEEESP